MAKGCGQITIASGGASPAETGDRPARPLLMGVSQWIDEGENKKFRPYGKNFASAVRARAMRDFTVPTDSSSARAISS